MTFGVKIMAVKKRFTWSRRSTKVKTTLDYWFIPSNFENYIDKLDIIPGFGSDHMAVEIEMTIYNHDKGPGYWKMNNSLLKKMSTMKGLNLL